MSAKVLLPRRRPRAHAPLSHSTCRNLALQVHRTHTTHTLALHTPTRPHSTLPPAYRLMRAKVLLQGRRAQSTRRRRALVPVRPSGRMCRHFTSPCPHETSLFAGSLSTVCCVSGVSCRVSQAACAGVSLVTSERCHPTPPPTHTRSLPLSPTLHHLHSNSHPNLHPYSRSHTPRHPRRWTSFVTCKTYAWVDGTLPQLIP
jgi:hypothetical protein